MKKTLLLVSCIFIAVIGLVAQSMCKIQGIVRYRFNDFIGYKPDNGAELYIIKIKDGAIVPNMSNWNNYEELYRLKNQYLDFLSNDFEESYARQFSGYSWDKQRMLNTQDSICFKESLQIFNNHDYELLIDGDGAYNIDLPYGEYYFIFKSNNRDRTSLTELLGRIHIEKIIADKPTKIVKYDFNY